MKIKQIIHSDGSSSFISEGLTIIKNKEDRTKQKHIEMEIPSVIEAMKIHKEKQKKDK
jgi:hypothetical protein